MDVNISKKPIAWYKKYWYLLVAASVFTTVLVANSQLQTTAFTANKHDVVIGVVKQGEFEVNVRGNGVLVPQDVRWLAADVEGRIERILVKPGALVNKGDLIVEMSNPQLVQLAEEIEWEIEAMTAENRALQVSLQSQLLDRKAARLKAQIDFDASKLKLDAEKSLLANGNGTVSMIEHQKSQLQTRQFKQQLDIEHQRYAKLEQNITEQLNAANARLNKLKKTLARAQHKVESLQVTASLTGVVQAMPLESGQQIAIGHNIAKLARQDQLLAELKIPERQIRDVVIGQTAIIDTRLNKISGKVVRIDPAVNQGSVQVDVVFNQPLPQEARPDLSIEGFIQISSVSNTLFVDRPTFAQSRSKGVIYKLNSDQSLAHKAQVDFGIGSSQNIEITHGLQLGDRIIISDHSAWQHLDTIAIN